MPLLEGRNVFVTGVLSNRSIAYGIARAARREGATLAFSYARERFRDRVVALARECDCELVLACDVSDDRQIADLAETLSARWGRLDGLVHSIAFAPREAITGGLLEGLSREAFRIAHDVSAYSFPALAKALRPLLSARASLLTLSYLGGERVVPNYNTMGLAKASLEAAVRYLAADLGPAGVRVNAISAGPIPTLAASGIAGFGRILKHVETHAPLRRNVTLEDIAGAAVFLLSDLASGVTGEVLHVDAGFHALGVTLEAARATSAPEPSG